MSDIQKIYEMLNWENADEIRAKGFCLAKEIEDLSLLILPPAAPSVWECYRRHPSENSNPSTKP